MILQEKDMGKLKELGGAAGLCSALGTDAHTGLSQAAKGSESVEEHRRVYGPNTLPSTPQKNFFLLCFENVQDPIILLLIAAALVSRCSTSIGSCAAQLMYASMHVRTESDMR